MKLSHYTDDETDASRDDETLFDSNAIHEAEHEQNDNWEWSDEFTEFIYEKIEGRSLKVCTGLRPIADVNLDIKHLGDVADSDEANFTVDPITEDSERLQTLRGTVSDKAGGNIIYGRITGKNSSTTGLYDGYACHGDMFDLSFKDNTFDTVITDPPWLDLSTNDRKQLFKEVIRVTRPTGAILYNATWIPDADHARQFQLRFRQQLDFWGGPSFAACYRREAKDIPELFEAHEYTSVERYPEDSPWWSEAYHPNAISTEHNTDPKKPSRSADYQHHCCPMCGCTQLGHLRNEFFESDDGTYTMYQCHNCGFRVDADEINRLAEALETAAAQQNCAINELTHIEYTPHCVKRRLRKLKTSSAAFDPPFTAELPWVPRREYHQAIGETDITTSPDNSQRPVGSHSR